MPADGIALGERQQVLAIGPVAQHLLLTNQRVLQIRAGTLHAPGHPAQLQRCLTDTARGQPTALALARPDRSPLTLRVECAGAAQLPARLLLTLRDPDLARPDPALLQAMLGLTATEAQVAVLLCEGDCPNAIAARLGVQPNTVKTHVRRLLTKSGTQRQAAFVALVLRSAAMLPPALARVTSPWPDTPEAASGAGAHRATACTAPTA